MFRRLPNPRSPSSEQPGDRRDSGLPVRAAPDAAGPATRLLTALILLGCASLVQAATYSLTVVGGSGSGVYEAGTVVPVWANPYERTDPAATSAEDPNPTLPTRIFDRWSGDTARVQDVQAWQTSVRMPAANVAIRALYGDTPRWTAPDVLTYFPPAYSGVIFFFHGIGGCSSCMLTTAEPKAFIQAAFARGYGVVAVQSFDRAGRNWDTSITPDNIDLQRVAEVRRDLIASGRMAAADPVFLAGVSAGGRFASLFTSEIQLALDFPVTAMALFISRGAVETIGTITVPIIFVAAAQDTTVPSTDVLSSYAQLVDRQVPTQYLLSEPTPLYERRFWRIEGLSASDSETIFAALAQDGFLDANGYILDDPAVSGWENSIPTIYEGWVPAIGHQLTAAYAGHTFVSHFTHRVLDFFANPVTVIDRPPAVSGFQPASGPVNTLVSIYGENFIDVLAVEIGGAAADFTALSATEIRALVPAAAQSGPIVVTGSAGTASSADSFTVDGPRILSFTPEAGGVDTLVTVSGENLFEVSEVTVGGVPAPFDARSPIKLFTRVPAGAVSGAIAIRTPQGVAVSPTELAIYDSPVIAEISATRLKVGDTVVLTGENLAPVETVAFRDVPVDFSVGGDHTLTTVVPPGLSGYYRIFVVSPGGTAASPLVRVD